MQYLKHLTLLIALLLQLTPVSAQFSLSLREEQVSKDVSTLWNVNVSYIGTKQSEELQLKLSVINSNDKTIYEVLSPYLVLSNKEIRQLNTGFPVAKIITNELQTTNLPDGNYEVVYREDKSNKELKRRQFTVDKENIKFTFKDDSGKFDVKKWINTTGSARSTSLFSSPPGYASGQKDFSSRLELNPTLVFFNTMPITASVLLSTEQTPQRQPMNQVSVNFDYNYFKTLMEKKALAKIEKLKSEGKLGDLAHMKDEYINKTHKGYGALKEKLASPEAKEQLGQLKEYTSLEKEKENLSKEIDRDKMQELKDKYHVSTLEELDAKKNDIPQKDFNELKYQMANDAAYTEAQKRMDELDGVRKKAKKLKKQKEKLDKMESTGYMEMLHDPKYSGKVLGQLGMINPATKLLGGIKSFNIGTSYPLYTELTMNGVRSNGFNAELNPGILYVAFTSGTIKNQRYDTSVNLYAFDEKVTAGRLGIGKKNATHFILTYINTVDKGNAFTSPRDSTVFTPGNNLVVGTDFQLSLFKKHFVTDAEFNGAYTTSDVKGLDVLKGTQGLDQEASVLSAVNFKPNLTTRRDYAYSVKSEINLFNNSTTLNGYYTYIGPGYTTFTAPYLLNDLLKYEVKLNQSFMKKKFYVAGFYKYTTDNLIQSKSYTTTVSGYGAEAGINFPRIPSLWAKYMPIDQVSNLSVLNQVGKLASNMFMAGSSYNLNLKTVSCNTQLLFNQYTVHDDFFATNIILNSYMLVQSLAFSNGINGSLSAFLNNSKDSHAQDQQGYSITGSGVIVKKVITALEFHYLTQGTAISKTGAMFNVGVKVIKNINMQLKVTYNSIIDPVLGNRNETFGSFMINIVW